MRRREVLSVAALAVVLVGAAPASAEPNAETVIRQTVDDAFTVLRDKTLSGKDHRPQRIAALRTVADRVFEWSEMARGSLGAAWRTLDADKRARFVDVFKDVLAARYMDDIDRFQGTETVTIDGSAREGEETVVRSTLVTSSRERVALDYRLRIIVDRWRVTDLSIEGVSLVNHFRKTFAAALVNMTVEQLTDRLRQRLPRPATPGGQAP